MMNIVIGSVLPGSWIYPQFVDFWDRKLSCEWFKAKSRVLWIFMLIADFVQLRMKFLSK